MVMHGEMADAEFHFNCLPESEKEMYARLAAVVKSDALTAVRDSMTRSICIITELADEVPHIPLKVSRECCDHYVKQIRKYRDNIIDLAQLYDDTFTQEQLPAPGPYVNSPEGYPLRNSEYFEPF